MQRHYRGKAAKILSGQRKIFDLKEWKRPRYGFSYTRKTNLTLADGTLWDFDFRNILESLFILNEKYSRYILARGGSGGSYQRFCYTVYTVIFHELGKRAKIKHHLLKYNSFNRFEYIKTFTNSIVTFDLGSNYLIPEGLRRKIKEAGVSFEKVRKLCEAHIEV